jgi:hypothetical protein
MMANFQIRRSLMASSTIPQAPRCMAQNGSSSLELLLEHISQIGAQKLYPRLALFEALSGFKDKHKPRQLSDNVMCEARRDFLDSFAYLCDVEKGGKTVTATALQKLTVSDFLWLAANEGIRDDIEGYAAIILEKLKTVNFQNQYTIQNDIFKLVVVKCQPRIEFYRVELQKYARNCRMALRDRERDTIGKLLSW